MSTGLHFVYGERTPEVMEAIIGRVPEFEPAILTGFGLYVQQVEAVQPRVREILAVNRTPEEMANFGAYAVLPEAGSNVRGLATEVTTGELDLLDNWDIEGLWFSRFDDRPALVGDALSFTRVSVHGLAANSIAKRAEPYEGTFPPAINDPARTVEIADLARIDFLAHK